MAAGVLERDSGEIAESPLAEAAARAWTGQGARVRADAVVLDLLPDLKTRRVMVECWHDWQRWDIESRTERTWREGGGPGTDMVRVTAQGWVDASSWRLRGGLAGLTPSGFAQGGQGDGMDPCPFLGVLLEQAVTGSPRTGFADGVAASGLEPEWAVLAREQAEGKSHFPVGEARYGLGSVRKPGSQDKPGGPGAPDDAGERRREPYADAVEAAEASRAVGAGPLEGIPGVPGADGVRDLSGDELLGAISAAQRQANRNEWLELCATAEFARRRYAEIQAATERGRPSGQRSGEFFCEEVSWATCQSARSAEERVELAVAMSTRLLECGARMAEGALDSCRLLVVHRATADLSTEHARIIDAALAPDAPGLTPEALRKRAWRLTLKLDPAAAAKRKKRAKKETRVESYMEDSGNAALAGRELDPEDVLAANAYYDAVAKLLRAGGIPGSLRELRALAFADCNTGRDPLARIGKDGSDFVPPGRPRVFDAEGKPANGPDGHGREDRGSDGSDGAGGSDGSDAGRPDDADGNDPDGNDPDAGRPEWRPEDLRDTGYRDDEPVHGLDALDDDDDDGDNEDDGGGSGGDSGPGNGPGPEGPGGPSGGASRPSQPSAPPANIHLLVPAGTVLGWSATPGELSKFGPVDAHSARDLVKNAARNPATRWHVTLVDESSGEAVAHACARGPRAWDDDIVQSVQTVSSEAGRNGGEPNGAGPDGAGPPGRDEQAEQVSKLLDHLGITEFEPIARGSCDHRHRESGYTPSRKLGDLVRARTATCPAPMCYASAVHNDLDHTVAWPDGETDECNISPPCRHHHRTKQAPGWRLEQVEPGIMRWSTPSGRTYETRPTAHQL